LPDELSALSAFAEVSGEAFGPELMPKGIPQALARGASFVGWLKARKPDSVLNENNLSMLLSSTLGKAPRMSCSKIAAGRIAFRLAPDPLWAFHSVLHGIVTVALTRDVPDGTSFPP